jgi:hypothetical protein
MTLADPDSVAKVLITAITTPRPRTLYTAGRGAGMLPMIGRLPDPLADAIIAPPSRSRGSHADGLELICRWLPCRIVAGVDPAEPPHESQWWPGRGSMRLAR